VAITLLAVDDSVTMRKVLEITFSSPDFRVVTATGPDDAVAKVRSDKPAVVITDTTLDPRNGYDLCKQIKQIAPGTPVVILSSKQNPYDAARGAAAQADDHMDKPFDTQQMIDKIKKLLDGRPVAAAAAPAAAAPAPAARPATPAPAPAPAPVYAAAAQPRPVATGGPAPSTAATSRAKTLIGQYSPSMNAPAPAPAVHQAVTAPPPGAAAAKGGESLSPTPATGVPLQSRAPAAAPAAAAAAHVNGQMAGKLQELGLSQAQVDAVMALSREVVERVVWEVVPVLAETIIKEEISRLTK
jgi:CheY-like chemotaxis protein